MATSSTTNPLTEADKTNPEFLVRLLTEEGNDAYRNRIYENLLAAKTPEDASEIITHEHIMTAIAGDYNKPEKILENALPLMILVFKDFQQNTLDKFNIIVERMTKNAGEYVEATDIIKPADFSNNKLREKTMRYLTNLSSQDKRNTVFYPRGKTPPTMLPPPPPEPTGATSLPALGVSSVSPPPLSATSATSPASDPGVGVSPPPLGILPSASDDPRPTIYNAALQQIKTKLESIKKYEAEYVGTFNQEDVSDEFNISTFFANLDYQVEEIKTKIYTATVEEINDKVDKYIENIRKLEKIKKVVRTLDLDSNILFFQFSILQNTNNRTPDENRRIEEARKNINEIVTIRKQVIASLIDKQNKVKELISFLEKITKKKLTDDEKFKNKNQIITQLSAALKEIMTPPIVNKKENKNLEEAKNKIYTTIPQIQASIQKNSDTNEIKNIKIDMLDRITEKLSIKTSEATKAREKANYILKPSYERRLEYADAALLSDKLIPYVTKIMESIENQPLNADSLALPKDIMTIQPQPQQPGLQQQPPQLLQPPQLRLPQQPPQLLQPPQRVVEPEISPEDLQAIIEAINKSELPIQKIYNKFISKNPFLENSKQQIQTDLNEFDEAVNLTSYAEMLMTGKQVENDELLEKFQTIISQRNDIIKLLITEISDIKDAYVDNLENFQLRIDAYKDAKFNGINLSEKEELVNESLKNFDIMEQKFQTIFNALYSESFRGEDVLSLEIITPAQITELVKNNREIKEAIEEMIIKKQEYERMKSSPQVSASPPVSARLQALASPQVSARGDGAGSPRGSARGDGTVPSQGPDIVTASSQSDVELAKKESRERFLDLIERLTRANNTGGIFDSTVRNRLMGVLTTLIQDTAGGKINYTVFETTDSNGIKFLELKRELKDYKEMLDEATDELKNLEEFEVTDYQNLSDQLNKFVSEYTPYKTKIDTLDYRLNHPQNARKGLLLGETPRGPRPNVALTAGGGGTRRGGKRFHKKTIKKNLLHKKTFKKNIVHNKIVHKKTSKNNIVKNNFVKNNFVKNKTIHKNQLKRKQTHKNN